ncbi:hypothetical protein C8J57DRAFT_1717651 [Mycena rebaudengoi]|nr:hypothetical protein C8J57DRAFT_1717651 [Mycena rebaudengoi]
MFPSLFTRPAVSYAPASSAGSSKVLSSDLWEITNRPAPTPSPSPMRVVSPSPSPQPSVPLYQPGRGHGTTIGLGYPSTFTGFAPTPTPTAPAVPQIIGRDASQTETKVQDGPLSSSDGPISLPCKHGRGRTPSPATAATAAAAATTATGPPSSSDGPIPPPCKRGRGQTPSPATAAAAAAAAAATAPKLVIVPSSHSQSHSQTPAHTQSEFLSSSGKSLPPPCKRRVQSSGSYVFKQRSGKFLRSHDDELRPALVRRSVSYAAVSGKLGGASNNKSSSGHTTRSPTPTSMASRWTSSDSQVQSPLMHHSSGASSYQSLVGATSSIAAASEFQQTLPEQGDSATEAEEVLSEEERAKRVRRASVRMEREEEGERRVREVLHLQRRKAGGLGAMETLRRLGAKAQATKRRLAYSVKKLF